MGRPDVSVVQTKNPLNQRKVEWGTRQPISFSIQRNSRSLATVAAATLLVMTSQSQLRAKDAAPAGAKALVLVLSVAA